MAGCVCQFCPPTTAQPEINPLHLFKLYSSFVLKDNSQIYKYVLIDTFSITK